MTVLETLDAVDAESRPPDEDESVTELLEQLARDVSTLAYREGRLAAIRHRDEAVVAVRYGAAGLGAAIALFTAFALLNVAALTGLSAVMPGWAAALVLAAVWAAVGLVVLLWLRDRWKRQAATMQDAVSARDEAVEEVRATLRRLSPALAHEVALAAVTFTTDELAEVADGFLDGADDFIEDVDDTVESLVGDAPGGGVVNLAWDVFLLPGRMGVRFATTVLGRSAAPNRSVAGAEDEDHEEDT